MEWSVGESQEIYSVVLSNDGEALALSSLTKDGNEMGIQNLQISSDDFPGRLVVVTEGTPKFAHVARVGDDWWIHLDGRVHVVRGHEKGGQKGQDSDSGLTTCLYFPHTTNAPTVLHLNKWKRRAIKCKRNRALFFDGSNMHHSTSPTDSNYRTSVNVDYKL